MYLFWLWWFLNICISQGSVGTQLRCGEIFNNYFVASCPQSVPVKKMWKSVNIWWRYGQSQTVTVFLRHSACCTFYGASLHACSISAIVKHHNCEVCGAWCVDVSGPVQTMSTESRVTLWVGFPTVSQSLRLQWSGISPSTAGKTRTVWIPACQWVGYTFILVVLCK